MRARLWACNGPDAQLQTITGLPETLYTPYRSHAAHETLDRALNLSVIHIGDRFTILYPVKLAYLRRGSTPGLMCM
jgi:hypothetical protein